MNDRIEDDAAFDEYLKGDSLVSQRYRQLGGGDVPPELDRRVLQMAHAAAGGRAPRPRAWVRWSAPLALAASVVLVVSVVLNSGVRHDETLLISEPAPAQDTSTASKSVDAKEITVTADRRRDIAAPAPVHVETPSTKAPMPIARAVAPNKPDIAADETAVTGSRAAARKQRTESEASVAAYSAAPARSADSASAPRAYSDPQRWLDDIRQLRKDGKAAAADREWARFRAAFPDYAVDDDDPAKSKAED